MIAISALLLTAGLFGCASKGGGSAYGVFIGLSPDSAELLKGYETVVIDAAYFTREQVRELRDGGQTVYSYLNIGSLEMFREYYGRFEDITLGDYEDWPGERWIDTADPEWRDFVCETLAEDLADKGVSGFFIDNADVYYNYPAEGIYGGLLDMLARLSAYGLDVVVNGGDTFIDEAIARGDLAEAGVTGVNQECVYTAIDFDGGSFHRQTEDETAYFEDYLRLCEENGLDVFVTEYADSAEKGLRDEIIKLCAKNGYTCYIASALELDGD